MNYYSRYPAHYLSKTLHLTMQQDGAYTRLLDWAYANERPIPDADKYLIARVSKKHEKSDVNFVLSSFFSETKDGWVNGRVVSEIDKAAPKIEAARINGLKGGRPKKEKPSGFTQNNPVGSSTETQSVISTKAPQSPIYIQEQKQDQKQKGGKPPSLTLPDWLPESVWADWHAFRNQRKGWTHKARELSLATLTRLRTKGHDPTSVIEQSIERGWTGLFEIKTETGNAHGNLQTSRKLSAVEQVEQAIRDRREREASGQGARVVRIGYG